MKAQEKLKDIKFKGRIYQKGFKEKQML